MTAVFDQNLPDVAQTMALAVRECRRAGRKTPLNCLACENMMLAAHSLGLGSCWVGFGAIVADDREVRSLLELREGDAIFGPILLGYPKVHPPCPPKKDPKVKRI